MTAYCTHYLLRAAVVVELLRVQLRNHQRASGPPSSEFLSRVAGFGLGVVDSFGVGK